MDLSRAEVVARRAAADEDGVGGFGNEQVFPLLGLVDWREPRKLVAIGERLVALPRQFMACRHGGCG